MELENRRIFTLEVCQRKVGNESHGSKWDNKGTGKDEKQGGPAEH